MSANGRVSEPGEVVAPPRAFYVLDEQVRACQRCSLGAGCKSRFRIRPHHKGAPTILVYDSRDDLSLLLIRRRLPSVRTVLCSPPATRYALASPGQVGACRELVHEYIAMVQPQRLICIGAQAWRELTEEPVPEGMRSTWRGYEVEIVHRTRSADEVFRLEQYLKEYYGTGKKRQVSGREA